MSASEFWALHAPLAPEIFQKMEARQWHAGAAVSGKVAIVAVAGVIDREAQAAIRADIDAAMANPAVNGVLLSLDSPGGMVAGTQELAGYIAACARQKPFAAYADGLCASAAYWLAAATGRVFAPATGQVGSIGVIAVHTSWQKALEESGIRRTLIYSGKYKAAGSPDKAINEEERQLFQSRIEAIHALFKTDIASFMRPSGDDWAEGQTFLAAEAKERGLLTRVVADQAEAMERLAAIAAKNEVKMDLKQAKAEFPDVLAEYAAEKEKEWREKLLEAEAAASNKVLALVKAVSGPEAAANVEKLLGAHVTPEQIEAMRGIFQSGVTAEKSGASEAPDNEAQTRKEMLAALHAAHGGMVQAAQAPQAGSSLVADAMRRAGEGR